MTSCSRIRQWLEEGRRQKATHVIVVCDTFDHSDYPVYVSTSENVREVEKRYDNKNMQRVMEVYNLALDIEQQLKQGRAFNY